MARSIELLVRIAVDAARAGQDIERAASSGERFKSSMGTLAVPATAAAAAVALFGKGALDAASAAQQSIGAVGSVFQDASGKIIAASQNSASAVGLSQSAYQQMASVTGASLKSMGLSTDEAADSTQQLITLGADLGATMGKTTAESVNALTSALRGEADPAEALGLNLKQSAIAAQMAADGTDKLTGSAKTAAQAHAIMTLATQQAGAANGAFAREADTAEGAAQRQAAAMDDAQAAIGQGLLPAYTALQTVMTAVGGWMKENSTLVLVLAGVLGGLAVAVLAVNAAIAIAEAATALWAAAQWVLNAAMAANPVVLVVIAIVALVAAVVLLWNNCEAFRTFILAMWAAISSAATAAWNGIMSVANSVINAVKGAISSAGSVITGVWSTIQSVASSTWNAISSVVSSVVSRIVSVVSGIVGAISSAWASIRSAAESAWNAISSTVSSVTSGISSFVNTMSSAIQSVFSAIMSAGQAIWGPIQSAASSALNGIMSIIDSVSGAIDSVIGGLQSAMSWVSDLWGKITGASSAAAAIPAPAAVASVGGFTAAQSPSLARSGLLAPRATSTSAGGGGVVINVSGALDPDAVARQIDALLRRRGRRAGGTVL